MPELAQFLLDHGASLESREREGFTLLIQAVLSMEPPPARDRMIEWLLSKGVDPNAKNDRGETAYQLAARMGVTSTMEILANPKAMAAIRRDRSGKGKYLPLSVLDEDPS